MSPLAATATGPAAAGGTILLILTAVTLGYGLACWLRPFTRCRHCHGTGGRRSLILRTIRTCWRCGGNGRHLRPGRRIVNAARQLHDRATHR